MFPERWPSTWPATSTSPSARRGAVAAPRPWWRWASGPPRWCCGSRWPGPWRRPPAARRPHRGTTATAWCTAWGCATAPAGPGNGRSRCPGVWHRRWRIRVRSGAGAIRNARENDVKWVLLRMLCIWCYKKSLLERNCFPNRIFLQGFHVGFLYGPVDVTCCSF